MSNVSSLEVDGHQWRLNCLDVQLSFEAFYSIEMWTLLNSEHVFYLALGLKISNIMFDT